MNKQSFIRLILLIAALTALFCLPALAEAAGVTRYVTNDAELVAAFKEANEIAELANAANQFMEEMTVIVTNDMVINSNISLNDKAKLHLTSEAGHVYTLSCDKSTLTALTALFMPTRDAKLRMSNLIFDGNGVNVGFLALFSGKCEMNNVTLEDFACSKFLAGLVVTLRVKGDYEPNMLTMRNCTVRNNTLGGAAYSVAMLDDEGTAVIDSCTFQNNVMTNHVLGGALALSGRSTVTNCTFTNNVALGGGAIYAQECQLTIEDCTFTGNKCATELEGYTGEGGGALHLKNGTVATITRCDFTGNTSALSGGAVTTFINTTATFNDCSFKDNVATSHGGAFCVADMFSSDETKASRITLNNCVLEGNRANGADTTGQHQSDPFTPGGGAIYLHEYCVANLNDGTVLKDNYARIHGGAVYISFGGRLTVNGAELLNNNAGLDGGAIYVDGANHYAGHSHANAGLPAPDNGFATGGTFDFKQGSIIGNTAGRNGGGVYVGGENEVIFEGERYIFTGGKLTMTGGIITENTAMDMGGGVYVGACDTGDKGGILDMTGGAICLNVAGENGNTSTGADDAGADVFSEGGNAYITVVTAERITAYIRNVNDPFVPASHHDLYFTNWYDDYSDQDPTYGKTPAKIGTGTNTGRYKSSKDPDRMVYKPLTMDGAYNALILDFDRVPTVPVTGDGASPLLWMTACILSTLTALGIMRRRRA